MIVAKKSNLYQPICQYMFDPIGRQLKEQAAHTEVNT